MMIDLNNIWLFVTVVQTGGFTAASLKLDIPANTISRRMSQLEDSLGVLLLIRTTRKLNLTTAGRRYYNECLEYIQGLEQANQNVTLSQREPQGVVRVTASIDFFKYFSFEEIADFMLQYPKIDLSFILDNHNLDLIEHNIDIAIRLSHLKDSTLIAKKISENQAGLFVHPSLLEQYFTPQTIQEIKQLPCILKPSEINGAEWLLHNHQKGEQMSLPVNGRFKVNSVVDQLKATNSGLGVGLLPLSIAKRDVERGNLIHLFSDFSQDLGGVYIVTPSLKFRSPAVQLVVDVLYEKLRKH